MSHSKPIIEDFDAIRGQIEPPAPPGTFGTAYDAMTDMVGQLRGGGGPALGADLDYSKTPLEIQAAAFDAARRERRYGQYRIGFKLLGELPIALAIQREVYVVEARCDPVSYAILYTAYSPQFAPVPEGSEAPFYDIVVMLRPAHERRTNEISVPTLVQLVGPANVVISLVP